MTRRWLPKLLHRRKFITKVGYSSEHDCWRIYAREEAKKDHWAPLEWLRFASCEVAEAHLQMYGEKLRRSG